MGADSGFMICSAFTYNWRFFSSVRAWCALVLRNSGEHFPR